MKKKVFSMMAMCLLLTATTAAQEVDKDAVTATAAAAQTAKEDLAKIEMKGDSPWKWTGVIGMNASATALVNWSAGGNNNVNMVGFANVRLLYKKDRMAWDTNLDTDLGASFLDNNNYPWQKTNDKINFSTKFGYEFARSWYATAVGTFRSQYMPGYEYKSDSKTFISQWLAPSYTDLSLGVDWKPNEIFSVYLSPVAGRITTAVVDDVALKERYGVDADKNFKAEAGMTLKGTVSYARIENFKVLSSLSLFTPYSKKFGNFDVDWDVAISYQFLKVLNVTLGTSLKYYDSVLLADKDGNNPTQRVQFKTVLGLGVGYSF